MLFQACLVRCHFALDSNSYFLIVLSFLIQTRRIPRWRSWWDESCWPRRFSHLVHGSTLASQWRQSDSLSWSSQNYIHSEDSTICSTPTSYVIEFLLWWEDQLIRSSNVHASWYFLQSILVCICQICLCVAERCILVKLLENAVLWTEMFWIALLKLPLPTLSSLDPVVEW
jgi:hypothetical protein